MQFILLCNPQKSVASQVRINFLQITQKIHISYFIRHISLSGTDHWNSKLSTNIQCKKSNQSAFLTIFLAYSGPLNGTYR